jgi:hypothetical protein
MQRPEGMLMAPPPNGDGGGGGGVPAGKKKPPTGEVTPTGGGDPNECKIEPDKPMEVVFTTQTFRRLIAWTFGPLLLVLVGGLGAFFYFYHSTNLHVSDPTIHLTRGERGKLETKLEAKQARTKLETDIKAHFDLKTGQLGVKNAKQITKIGNELRAQQKGQYHRLLREIKKAN